MAVGDRHGNSISTKRWGWIGVDEAERREREIADAEIVFAGRGRNRDLVHVIEGAAKGQRDPHAKCGLWVANQWRAPLESERVCSKCAKGGTSFTRRNQPRECLSCGKLFADTRWGDNTQETCGACYIIAGYENAHSDGHHDDQPEPECPEAECQRRIHAFGGHEVEGRLDLCEVCVEETRVINLRMMHERGEHETAFLDACPLCVEDEERRQVAHPIQPVAPAEIPSALVEHRRAVLAFHLDTLAAQLRSMASEVERQGTLLLAAANEGMGRDALLVGVQPLANELLQLPGILDVPALIMEAVQVGAANEGRQA